MNSRAHTTCRLCRQDSLELAFDLGEQPLANGFHIPSEGPPPKFPLEVMVCLDCGLAQISTVVDPAVLYSFYRYVTSPSRTMAGHFFAFWERACSVFGSRPSSVLEIGSNDGRLLADWKPRMKSVFGIDPAKNLADRASKNGIPTLAAAFCSQSAKHIAAQDAPPDIIVARHVFCHIDDWWDAFAGLDLIAGPDTVIMIEVPDATNLLANGEFDTIYHEHLSYLTPENMRVLLQLLSGAAGVHFRIVDEWHIGLHGGSVVFSLKRGRDSISVNPTPEQSIGNWRNLALFADRRCQELRDALTDLEMSRVCGYGCPAKSTVLLSMLGGPFGIRYITDTTPDKVGLLHPVGEIPIVSPERLLEDNPDVAVLFAWNFQKEILEKETALMARGTRFLIPLPTLTIQ
jgi:SAM-dependent methyltransferase